MGRTARRHYRGTWVCPACGGEQLIECQGAPGKLARLCATCRDVDGYPIEATRVLDTLADPPNRNRRLFGFNSPLRKTRSR